MKKLFIGLAAVSLLVSCGLIKSPPIQLVNKERAVGQNIGAGGGALGIDGKGRPISLVQSGLTVQAVQPSMQSFIGTFEDSIISADAKQYLDRLDTWGASQDIGFKDAAIADAVLVAAAGKTCPSSFELSNLTASLLLTSDAGLVSAADPLNYVPVTSATTVIQDFAVTGTAEFTEISGKPCEYKVKVKGDSSGKKPELNVQVNADKLGSLKTLLKDNQPNYTRVKMTLSYDNAIVQGTLTVYFGASSAYVIGVVF